MRLTGMSREIDLSEPSLKSRRTEIVQRWLECAVRNFNPETRRFLIAETDRFQNPIGHALCEGLPLVFDAILEGGGLKRVIPALDPMVRILALQPGGSNLAEFFGCLEGILLHELSREGSSAADGGFPAELHGRFDELAALARDLETGCFAQIGEIRAREAKRRSHVEDSIRAKCRSGSPSLLRPAAAKAPPP
jgi:hypothetical protein